MPIPYYTMDLHIEDEPDELVNSFIKNNHLEDSNIKQLLLTNIEQLKNTIIRLDIGIHCISSYVTFNYYIKESYEKKFVYNEKNTGYYSKTILIHMWRKEIQSHIFV